MALEDNSDLNLMIESNRLSTFRNWPNPNISPESLAKAGFFYLNRSDEVKCAWCKGVIAQWEKQDDAFQEHRRFFPECPRAQLGPLIEIASAGIRDLGIQEILPAKNPKFSSLDARLRTYTNWPIPNIQEPEMLAQAGLYYQEVDDQVRCFHCNMGLRSWEKEDDPWFEHAKWYPMCHFVRLVKGANYVQEVQELTRSSASHSADSPCMTIEEAMLTAPVRLALEMGVNGGIIRNETLRQLNQSGKPYANVDDLLKAVFDERKDIEERNSGDITFSSYGSDCAGYINNHTFPVSTDNSSITLQGDNSSSSTTNCSSTIERNSRQPESSSANPAIQQKPCNVNIGTNLVDEPVKESSLSLEEENRKLKDARLCKICLDEEVAVVYLPCGHLGYLTIQYYSGTLKRL